MFPFDDVIMSLQAVYALIIQIIHLPVKTFCGIFCSNVTFCGFPLEKASNAENGSI